MNIRHYMNKIRGLQEKYITPTEHKTRKLLIKVGIKEWVAFYNPINILNIGIDVAVLGVGVVQLVKDKQEEGTRHE